MITDVQLDNTIVGHIKNGFLGRMMRYSPPAVVVWLALAKRASKSSFCFPSISTLREDTGLARSTVYKCIDELEDAGEISVKQGGGKGNPSNHYRILGGPFNGLVQTTNQSVKRIKVDQTTDKGGPQIGRELDEGTKRKNQTKKHVRFVVPTVDDVRAYCEERKNGIDPQAFIDYYKSNGWKVGRNKMKDWRASVRTWEHNKFSSKSRNTTRSGSRFGAGQRHPDDVSDKEGVF